MRSPYGEHIVRAVAVHIRDGNRRASQVNEGGIRLFGKMAGSVVEIHTGRGNIIVPRACNKDIGGAISVNVGEGDRPIKHRYQIHPFGKMAVAVVEIQTGDGVVGSDIPREEQIDRAVPVDVGKSDGAIIHSFQGSVRQLQEAPSSIVRV